MFTFLASYRDIFREVAKITAYDHPLYSSVIHLLCLTGQRRGRFSSFSMDWIDGDTLTFPASVMKSGRAHTIHVTGYGKLLTPQSFSGWSKAKLPSIIGIRSCQK